MRKISLDANELRVDSFETENGETDTRGTVQGYYSEFTCPLTMCGRECRTGFHDPCGPTAAFTDGQVMCSCGTDPSRDCE